MSPSERREVEHEITISAPAEAVYRLITDVENWPRLFPPTIYADYAEKGEREERIRIWATANNTVKNWISRRVLDPEKLRIDFRQEASTPPIAAMGGAWLIEPASPGESRVRLLHDYQADAPENLAWLDEVVERNSRTELAALKASIELDLADLTFSFEDTVEVDGAAKDVFDFINEAHRWPERLPHVATVQLDEEIPGLQTLEMDTRSHDGSVHTTKSYRVTFPHAKIAYKQVTLPALLTLHTGYWTVRDRDGGVAVSSQHTFAINTAKIAEVLGAGATVADAKEYVRKALSTNSMATMGHAKKYAENGGR